VFRTDDSENLRALYRRHARGNSLYKNRGDGTFSNVGQQAGVEMGRWSWSSDAWDFDHDGYSDLYIVNGYLSGTQDPDLASFFWRQVVAKSPPSFAPSPSYEAGWNAIHELIRSDSTWNGYERNVLYSNNRDGTFSEISGVSGLDFPDDSRAFAVADLDHDGKLEVILKNRNAPQLRILRNQMRDIGNSIAFRLRGTRSNRDAIGAAVTVGAGGRRQTKYLQAGSGFLSQHTKELFFGLGDAGAEVHAAIRWPSGLTQTFEKLPVNRRIEIVEGDANFRAQKFATPPPAYLRPVGSERIETLRSSVGTWLIQPLAAPPFSLPDLAGKNWDLRKLHGNAVLLTFWTTGSEASKQQLKHLRAYATGNSALLSDIRILAINLDASPDLATIRSLVHQQAIPFPLLLATAEIAGTYNILFRYLFDRHQNLGTPASFLINDEGMVVKVYQGIVNPDQLATDVKSIPRDPVARIRMALPFQGALHLGTFQRNDFTYGVAFFQHGYFDQAAESFKQVIAEKPDDPEAYYNLGTLCLRRRDLGQARQYLEQTVKLKPNYAEAWNNLGMLAAEEGHADEAVRNFKQSLSLRPDYSVPLVNLGNMYRRQKSYTEAEEALDRAIQIQPDDPEVNYSLGMLYAQQDQTARAAQYLQKAVDLRAGYPDALNNLGVLFVREQRYVEAEARFQSCIQANPDYDQAYLNLARLYVMMNDKARAKDVLQALLQKQPQHEMARQALEMLQ